MNRAWDEVKRLFAEQDALNTKLGELARSMGADYVKGKIVGDEHLSAQQLRALAAALGEIIELGARIQFALRDERFAGLN